MYIIITSVQCTVVIHVHEFSTVCTDLPTLVTIEVPALQCQLWAVSVHTTPSPRQRTWPCQWCPVDLREKAQATSVEGRGERRGEAFDGSHERSFMDANEAVTNTTSWQLTVIHRDNRAGMSRCETYPGEEPFWPEGGGMGPVGTERREGELQGTDTMAAWG